MISFKSERTRHRIGCGEGVYRVGMGAGGQWAAGEGVADGAHGFRVVKISSGFRCAHFSIGNVLFPERKFLRITLPKTLVLFLHTRRVPEST